MKDRAVLVAGVMDGHGGTAASKMVSESLPDLVHQELVINRLNVSNALERAWDATCKMYQRQCTNEEECVADYDPREGILMANTGSEDLVAGTTASVMALDEKTGRLTILNCGDSRSVVVGKDGSVAFVTQDHKPEFEVERLEKGVEEGLDYSLPQCSISRWWLQIGDYEYSVSRSLEGPFATSKGIVSDPEVFTLQAEDGMILVSATDGLWEVMDADEVAKDLNQMRAQKLTARDAARNLCSLALGKGTSDNVSAVVVYL